MAQLAFVGNDLSRGGDASTRPDAGDVGTGRGCGRKVDVGNVGAGVSDRGTTLLKGLRTSKSPECLSMLHLLHLLHLLHSGLYLLLCSQVEC